MASVTLTTGPSVPLLGTVKIAASLLDSTASQLVMKWDISAHLAGNPASMVAQADISFDGGLTWNFLCSAERDQGYAPLLKSATPTLATITHPIPGAGQSRMIRASLTASATVTTSMQVALS